VQKGIADERPAPFTTQAVTPDKHRHNTKHKILINKEAGKEKIIFSLRVVIIL
jgi:hypothetical protein